MSNAPNINYAVVAAFERSKVQEKRGSSSKLLAVVLMAVFFIVLMIGLASGVTVYQKVALTQRDTNNLHMQAGLLANTIHVNDAADVLTTAQGPEGPALVLEQHLDSGTYEMRIYYYKGAVVQEYAIAGRPFSPESADVLVRTNQFSFDVKGNLITFTTDQGKFYVALRSDQGGAA